MTTTRASGRARCSLHGLSADREGRCALCRTAAGRTNAPLLKRSAWLLGALALPAGGLLWLEHARHVPPPAAAAVVEALRPATRQSPILARSAAASTTVPAAEEPAQDVTSDSVDDEDLG